MVRILTDHTRQLYGKQIQHFIHGTDYNAVKNSGLGYKGCNITQETNGITPIKYNGNDVPTLGTQKQSTALDGQNNRGTLLTSDFKHDGTATEITQNIKPGSCTGGTVYGVTADVENFLTESVIAGTIFSNIIVATDSKHSSGSDILHKNKKTPKEFQKALTELNSKDLHTKTDLTNYTTNLSKYPVCYTRNTPTGGKEGFVFLL